MATLEIAVQLLAQHIAEQMILNAVDQGDDVNEYSTDEEVVELYLKDLSSLVASALTDAVKDKMNFIAEAVKVSLATD
jgi:cell fate (sporulation/competence/biofilm development) regulator YlbF (YheA/YmcA/DUF963 family)